MSRETLGLFLVLIVMGAGWGLTQPLAKIAVSDGYRHFGLVFWQLAIGAIVLGTLQIVRQKRLRTDASALAVYVLIALVGTVIPNSTSYEAMRHLPSGLVSILLASVPMMAFPIALVLRNEPFSLSRASGLLLGLAGVMLIVAPKASLPDRDMVAFIPLALVAPFFYGLEGNLVARFGTAGLGPVEVLLGGSLIGAVITLPLALMSGQFIDPRPPWSAPDAALTVSALIHVTVYSVYVWMVGRAGPIFAVQVSYLVTGFGVLWAILFLDESYSAWVWSAMAVMLLGMFLVQPRIAASSKLVEPEKTGEVQ